MLKHRPEHLLETVRREWADLDARRGLRRLEAQLRETERRCDSLIASSRDPVAYIHEGMHIRANDAYLANLYGVHGVARLCQQELPHDCGLRYCHSLYLASRSRDASVLQMEGDARRVELWRFHARERRHVDRTHRVHRRKGAVREEHAYVLRRARRRQRQRGVLCTASA